MTRSFVALLAVAAAGALPAAASASCFFVYSAKNELVYRSTISPVDLSKPIEHDGKTYTRFTFREPVTGDYAASDLVSGEFNKTLAVLALMAGSSLPVFQKIPMREFKKISAATQGFLSELAAEI